jgi:hypothetical protein
MKLQNILLEQKRVENKKLLENITHDLLPQQRYIIEGIYKELEPLIEASLTADQIKSLFGEVEKQSIAGGKSRTLTGGAVDVAKKAKEVIDNVGRWLQDTAPVKMADQKFEDLKSKIGAKFPEMDKQLTGFGTWMKENPGKSAAIIGVLTAVASLAGGPVGGAVAGQILRGSAELIKGEKLSTSVGKGVKTAVLGFIAGSVAEKLGEWMSGLRANAVDFNDGLTNVTFSGSSEMSGPGWSWTKSFERNGFVVMPDDKESILSLIDEVNSGTPGAFDKLYNFAQEINTQDYKDAMAAISAGAKEHAVQNDSMWQALQAGKEAMQAASQGAVAAAGAAADGKKKQESYYIQQRPLSEGQVYILFDRIENYSRIDPISEGPMDALKKAGGTIAKGAQWVGKQATEKITSAKLMASWKLAGSPTDSAELAKFLKDEGVEDAVIDASYSTMNLPSQSTAEKPADDSAEKQPLGTFGYDEFSGMAFANAEERAEYYQLIGKKDPGPPKKPKLNPGAEPWDAEKFKQEELPYVQASNMVIKLPTDRKVRLLKALLKTGSSTPAEQPTTT